MHVIRGIIVGFILFATVTSVIFYVSGQEAAINESLAGVFIKIASMFFAAFVFPLVVLLHGTWALAVGSPTYWWWTDSPLGKWGVVEVTALGCGLSVLLCWASIRWHHRVWSCGTWAAAFGTWFVTAVFSLGAVTGGA